MLTAMLTLYLLPRWSAARWCDFALALGLGLWCL